MTSSSLEDPRERINELSLIMQGPYEGRPYSREDFRDSLGAIFNALDKAMLAIGPLNRNHEWHLIRPSDNAQPRDEGRIAHSKDDHGKR